MQPASTAGNAGESPTPRPAASSAWRREPAIWGLGFGIFGGTAAGLLVIGNLLPMARAFRVGPSAQAVAITLFAFGNAAGRIVWGWLTDRLDWRAVEASLASLLVGMTLLIATETLPDLFIPAVLLVGFGFGACFVVYAGIVARHHGPWGVGTIYPWLFALYGVAGVVAPTIGASIYESTGSFRPSLLLSIGTLIAAILANVLVHLVANRHAASQVIAEPPPASACRPAVDGKTVSPTVRVTVSL